MNITIDARLYGLSHAGIGRYSQHLIDELLKKKARHTFTFITHQDHPIVQLPPPHRQRFVNFRHYSHHEQLYLPSIIQSTNPDLIHFLHFNVPILTKGPFIVTIHDLLWYEKFGFNATTQSKATYLFKYFAFRLVMRQVLHRATHIITPTHAVKKKIITTFHRLNQDITVTHEAAAPSFFKAKKTSATLKKYALKPPFVIYTGSLYSHKNPRLLLELIKNLPKLTLAIASARDVFSNRFQKDINHAGLAPRVRLLGFVPDSDLANLYAHSVALLLPSQSEGFGLTGLEAMAAGCPVIAANHPVLAETYQRAALLTQPTPRHFSIALESLQNNSGLRASLIKKGRLQAQKYSWKQTATLSLNLYERLLHSD